MELLAKLIEAALVAVHDCCVIDWLPTEGAPESFEAECEIEANYYRVGGDDGYWNGDFYVFLAGVFVIIGIEEIGAETMEWWHAEKLEVIANEA